MSFVNCLGTMDMKFSPVVTLILTISIAIGGLLVPRFSHADENAPGDYIKVEVRGKLNNGIMAIGGETTGVNITASSAQTIENGQTITFTGSSRSATITTDVVVKTYGDQNLTITLELDNILTVG